ncbi:NAD(P)/FAD-dependent oxidoreductase [Roseomonas marmotae]|uniref:NAD(P)/FAD-dependent oxidoreductase n=1 Tax=Roseomonas marmotae TaxID=2768161 RepID=A0ABS3K913_9PROT|nr:NAD(P)/FAD-dependent oxidoreductase [Roseomonas marmotae]MBO1073954.1 NAD(P)/FAD-dependent oxidoreductase [Roseomonas marmotae]QTI78748.1 NAD(P)/FAD-dependent oxidoreductase [Roseomonas marmotae]
MEPKHIVIVGGGAAGLHLATRLGRQLKRRPGEATITLIDRDYSHIWKPLLHEVAAGTLDTGVEQVGFIPQASRSGFRYWPGEMTGLDRGARRVRLAPQLDLQGDIILPEREVPYDILVLAVGSSANDFGIPGVLEHALFIDSRSQAEAFNTALRAEVMRCLAGPEEMTLDIAIVGAGATGVELSAELNTAFDLAAGYGLPNLRKRLRLTLVETAPRILGALPERVAAASQSVLERVGVTVLTNAQVSAVEEDALVLKDGRRIPAKLKVWAAGIKAPTFLRELDGLEAARNNQLVVRPTLQASQDDSIYVLGDCAALTPPGAQRPLPATAQVAHQQAAHLADSLAGTLRGRAPTPFTYREQGALVALGRYNAFGSLGRTGLLRKGGLFIQGWFAHLSYSSLYRRHQLRLFGFWRVLLYWASDFLRHLSRPGVRLE